MNDCSSVYSPLPSHTTGKDRDTSYCPTCWGARREYLLSLTSSKGAKKKKNKRKGGPQTPTKSVNKKKRKTTTPPVKKSKKTEKIKKPKYKVINYYEV